MSLVSIVIPLYNEENTIKEVVESTIKEMESMKRLGIEECKDYEIIVVDDGSTDESAEILKGIENERVIVLQHPYNKGNGMAVKTGAKKAKGDIIVILDADMQHDPRMICYLLKHMEDYEMVIVSRNKQSIIRGLGNKILNKCASYLLNIKIPDLTSGFRAIRKEIFLRYIHLLPNGFSTPTTLTMTLLQEGHNIKFIESQYLKTKKKTNSKISPFKDGMKFLIIICRMVILYNPLKIFIPLSILLCIPGVAYLFYELIVHFNVPDSATLLVLGGIITLGFGLLADSIAMNRRENI